MSIPLSFAQLILIPTLERTLDYAHRVLDDIPADRFCLRPHPTMNHPAFCVGHLSLYPHRLASILGRPEAVAPAPDGWQELFAAGTPCVDDDGRYPQKDALLETLYDRHAAAQRLLEGVSDAQLHQPNPMEGRMRELFPSVGMATAFLTGHHLMLHLGQISAWRRAAGLPAAG